MWEENTVNEEFNYNKNTDEDEYLYKSVMEGKKNSRIWSVVSLICSILSLLCCCTSVIGIVLGVLAIIFAVVSRSSIGYFDGLAIAGLIVGIFGTVFSLGILIIVKSPWFAEFVEELEKAAAEGGYSEEWDF